MGDLKIEPKNIPRGVLGKRWVIATHNSGKLAEVQALMAPFGIEVISALALNLPEPDETGTTFAENALLKAEAAARASDLPALADDSGLSVAALGGAPGIHSARWAELDGGTERDFALAMRKVEEGLADQKDLKQDCPEDRSAAFICCLALALPTGEFGLYEGRVEGEIVWPPRGKGGFGYDPIFVPERQGRSFAQMTQTEKQSMSHRGRAFRAMVAALFPAESLGQ